MEDLVSLFREAGWIIIVVGIIAISIWYRHRSTKKWKSLALELGLQFQQATFLHRPEIRGQFRNHQVHIYTYSTGGRSNQTYTVVRLFLNHPVNLGLQVYKEGFFSKIGKAVGSQDIQLNDPQFDEAMMVKGNEERAVKNYLTPSLRTELLRLLQQEKQIQFDDLGIQLRIRGMVADIARLKESLQNMQYICDVADSN
ncbi:hypothetical protein ACFL27_06430 [candidate division CSSED10-310 bacterium]|uniref:Uncharacterized protein n=1 Tax=candidate division CSSED10-310 bacterium TaxID=2855610 RepID=A0ABV6YUG5_UNCC1